MEIKRIVLPPQDLVKAAPPAALEEVLAAVGHSEAWVSDLALVVDFCEAAWLGDADETSAWLLSVSARLGIEIKHDTLVCDAARMVAKAHGWLN